MKAVFLTAGAAGMYCGSCMHDNAMAKALRQLEVDCVLQPVYTPIRTDDVSIASDQLFFGGIHIYLLQQFPGLKRLPRPLRRLLDWRPLLQFATRKSVSYDSKQLGELSISMLRGVEGRQADEVRRIAKWLSDEMNPDAIIFTNLLIGGCLPELVRLCPGTKRLVLLQGDDIFLDHLPDAERSKAVDLCRRLVPHVDHFVVNSDFYAQKMKRLLGIPDDQLYVIPLSIDTTPYQAGLHESAVPVSKQSVDEFRVGYFARIAPEKGLHHLVHAFIGLAKLPGNDHVTLHVAGWLGEHQQTYYETLKEKIKLAGLADRFVDHGSPSLSRKVALLKSFDVTCVPTDYQDPKGLFALESLAAGTPLVLPNHGAFPEMIQSTRGGLLFEPGDEGALINALLRLRDDQEMRDRLGIQGKESVHSKHSIERAAAEMKKLCFSSQDHSATE